MKRPVQCTSLLAVEFLFNLEKSKINMNTDK